MKSFVIYLLEVLVCSGVLLAAHSLLLERHVRFPWSRAYLLSTPLLAVLIPLLRIPLWPSKAVTATSAAVVVGEMPQTELLPAPAITPEAICTAVYLLGTLLVLGSMCRQLLRIRRIRRDATLSRSDGITIVSCLRPIAPFSFLRSIYLWADTPAEDLKAIVAHEASHISHGHSFERIVMELLKALLWWNPFVWLAAHRLTETEEFEADQDVLRGGFDTHAYMNAIFKQFFNHSPDISNGLRNSFTKKRFLMMTTQRQSRSELLRLAGTLPALLGLLCAFSFTSKATTLPASYEPRPSATPLTTQPTEEPALLITEVMPRFQNGDLTDFRQWAQSQIRYPDKALKHKIEGRVVVSFVIEHNGSVSSIETLQSPDQSLTDEAHRIIASSPKWTPGTNGGNTVRVKYTLPIDFKTTSNPTPTNKIISISINDGVITKTTTEVIGEISSKAPVTDENAPLPVADLMPNFKGGNLLDFRQWVQSQIRYPDKALKHKIEGRVVVSFVIERSGAVSSIETLQSPDPSLTDEAHRIIASSPKWTPGTNNGKTVRVKYTLPIEFNLTDSTTAAQ